MDPARHNRSRAALTLAQRIDAIANLIDFLDLLDEPGADMEPESDMDVEDWNVAMRNGGSLLGPGDLEDAEENGDDEPSAPMAEP